MARSHAGRLRTGSAAAAAGMLIAGLYAAPASAREETPSGATGTVARTVGDAAYEPGPCPKTAEPVAELDGARCGTLTVPENRTKPDGRKITLGVAIVAAEAAEPKPDPIVWLAGGPGDDAVGEAKMAIGGGLNRDRDVIFMSQRGTYSADPALTCRNVDEFNARATGLVSDAPSTEREHVAATKACRDELAATGADLSAYNDIESAADYAALRTTLGLEEWNLYGISYGTQLALVTMRLHPEESGPWASTASCRRPQEVRPSPGPRPGRVSTACSRPARSSPSATIATRTCRPPSNGSSENSKPSPSPPP